MGWFREGEAGALDHGKRRKEEMVLKFQELEKETFHMKDDHKDVHSCSCFSFEEGGEGKRKRKDDFWIA